MNKIYFFDFGAFNPHRMSNVEIRANQVIKEKVVLFKEEEDWEVRFDNSYPNVFYDPKYDIYRCYYSTFTKDRGSSECPISDRKGKAYPVYDDRVVSLCYAESKDGINWTKPNLSLVEFNGNKNNNILAHFYHGTSVLFDERERDDSKRYKMFTKVDLGNSKDHFMAVCFSEDGIHFSEPMATPNFNPRGDTHNVILFDEVINKYVLISRTWRDSMRNPIISYSDDFIHWSEPVEPIASRNYSAQIYSMPIFKRGNYTLGLASMYHEGDKMDENYDTVDVELTYSYKNGTWNYVSPEHPFIPISGGDYGENFDASCIYTALPVEIGDRTYFYYVGGNGTHNGFREGSFARAYIENDRWAYACNKRKDKEAFLYTNSIKILGENVFIDFELEEKGEIKIEAFDSKNHSKLDDIKVSLEKISNKYKIIFEGALPSEFRLGITFKDAKIYSLEGDLELIRIESETSLFRG